MSSYSDKLKDVRWQKKRLQIMAKQEWTCQNCGDTQSPLHVHHTEYKAGLEPWEYPEEMLICLCESCHESTHKASKTAIIDPLEYEYKNGNIEENARGYVGYIRGLSGAYYEREKKPRNLENERLQDERLYSKILIFLRNKRYQFHKQGGING